MTKKNKIKDLYKKEGESFDKQTKKRIKNGFIPDLRNLKKVNWFYNNIWREPKFFKIHWGEIIEEIIKESNHQSNKVLEVGCGTGYLSLELAIQGLDVTGVDISKYSIDIAEKYKKKNKNKLKKGKLKYVALNFNEYDFNEKYDTIIFFRSLHHFPNIKDVFNKINSISKKNSKLIIFEPVRSNFDKNSAIYAMILRTILPTWMSYSKKIDKNISIKKIQNITDKITNEFKYENEKGKFVQSPFDNSITSEKEIIKYVKKRYKIKSLSNHDAFSDKIIGGIRGKDRFILAKFIKTLDNYLVKNKILRGNSFRVIAKKFKN